MVSRLPEQADVDRLRASIDTMPPGEMRTALTERAEKLQELVTDLAGRPTPVETPDD